MKKLLLLIPALAILFSPSCKDDKDKIDDPSQLIGRWEITRRLENGVNKPLNDECERDKVWVFSADKKVMINDPCAWQEAGEVWGNWKVEGNVLHVDAAVGLNATTKIHKLTDSELILERAFGTFIVYIESYRKTNKKFQDYAKDAEGKFAGRSYLANYVISEKNLPDTYVLSEVNMKKTGYNRFKTDFCDFNVMNVIDTVKYDRLRVRRAWGETYLSVPDEVIPREFDRGGIKYKVQVTATKAVFRDGVDSFYVSLNIIKGTDKEPSFYMYFKGKRE